MSFAKASAAGNGLCIISQSAQTYRSVGDFPLAYNGQKKPNASENPHWARGLGGLLSLLLNSHIAEFFRAVLCNQQVCASQDKQQDGDHYCKDEHFATPFFD